MVDDSSIIEQFHEIMHINNQLSKYQMKMDESIVYAIMEKLHPSWKQYKNS